MERNNLIIDWKEKRIEWKNDVQRPKLKKGDTTLGQEICELRENNEELDLSYIPKEYKDYLDLFRKMEKDNMVLPPHKLWDYEINLVEGKEVPFGLIYQMLEEELKTLREFIDVFMKRGWIQESMLLARVLVMCVPKKNRKKRLVVNY